MEAATLELVPPIPPCENNPSEVIEGAGVPPKTLEDLLCQMETRSIRNFASLKSKGVLLSEFFSKTPEQITIDEIEAAKPHLRHFLESRRLKENSIRTYRNEISVLLKLATEYGWRPDSAVPKAWIPVMAQCGKHRAKPICRFLIGLGRLPDQVLAADVDRWILDWVTRGGSYRGAKRREAAFWRALVKCAITTNLPPAMAKCAGYGIPLDHFPAPLKGQIEEILRWKQAEWSQGRPRTGRHRPVTAKNLRDTFCVLYGFATTTLAKSGISTVADLFTKEIATDYVDWAINVRASCGQTVRARLVSIEAALRYHPQHRNMDLSWVSQLLREIPTQPKSEQREKQIAKQIPYGILEAIPAKIRSGRRLAAQKGRFALALNVRNELLIKWLTILAWRQKNIRFCRIEGPRPNVFKGPIESGVMMARFDWVEDALRENPAAEFWQFRFSAAETKVKNGVRGLIPSALIPLLEEYIREHRPHLIQSTGCELLFPSENAKAIHGNAIDYVVGELTLRHGGKALSTHIFRHILAYAWLHDHPKDYLTLSKILWHTDIKTTLDTYGAGFDESDGMCGLEAWRKERSPGP